MADSPDIGAGRRTVRPRFRAGANRARSELRFRRVHKASVVALAMLAEHKDPYASQHILRVSRLADDIARVLQQSGPYRHLVTEQFREELRVASMLHDVGKVAIPDGILQKPGRLTPEERAVMQRHCDHGRSVLERAGRLTGSGGYLPLAAAIAGAHHEKYDGTGYPRGTSGDGIPLAARIVAVADVFDALTHRRVYKEAWPVDEALAYLAERRGSDFDPAVVDAFLEAMRLRAVFTIMSWHDGMSVGVEELDNDHRTLIDLLNQLTGADRRHDRINLESVLDELVDYTVFHFEREEALMAAAGFPDGDAHRLMHRLLTDQVMTIRRRLMTAPERGLGDHVMEFLSHWLADHIMKADMRYAPFLAPCPPEHTPTE